MEATGTLEYGQGGYSMKKVIASIVLATVLHVVVLGAYFIFGSSKKPPAPAAAAAKPDEPAKGTPPAPTKDGKQAETTAAKTPNGTGAEKKTDKTPEEIKKSSEVAKPGEIPSKPDTDIDDILKRK
jgi:hypothetical protein